MKSPSKKQFNFASFFLGFFLIAVSCLIFYSFGNQKPAFIKAMDNQVTDMKFKIRGPVSDSGQVVIVDIDEKSLGQFGQWPWPRNILATLTDNLFKNKARSIGFDIVFAEKDRTSPLHYFENLNADIKEQLPERLIGQIITDTRMDYDALFGDALSKGPSVLGYAFQMKDDGLKSDENTPFPSSIIRLKPEKTSFKELSLIPAYRAVINHPSVSMAQSEGFFNVFEDASGTTRQVPLMMKMDNIPYPSLALEIYRLGTKIPEVIIHTSSQSKTPEKNILGIQIGDDFIPTDSFGQLSINYRGPVNTFKYISAADILTRTEHPMIEGKFVLVGSSATGLFDLKTTPLSAVIPGIEINANIIDNLIQSDPFTYDIYTEIGLTYVLILAGGFFISLVLSAFGPLAGTLGSVCFLSSVLAWDYYYFFLNNRHVGMTYPLLTCTGIFFVVSVFNSVRERKNKQFIKKAFSHYVTEDVVSHLIKHPDKLSLKGEEKELSVFFCDIRGFTSIAETMNSQELGNFMNIYLTRMSQTIMKNNGTVDKFIGDAIMAFWGAPTDEEKHAFKAVQAAIELKEDLEQMHGQFSDRQIPRINVGVGINTGLMNVGNFGSQDRFDYTVMGDNVNLASRLEGANKNYGTTILISESTRNLVKEDIFCRYIDKVIVKGRKESVDLYEPLTIGAPPEEILKEVLDFHKGVDAYQKQEFENARKIIGRLNKNHPQKLYQSYIDRIEAFIISPPPSEWNGAERRTHLPVNKLLTK